MNKIYRSDCSVKSWNRKNLDNCIGGLGNCESRKQKGSSDCDCTYP